MHVCILKLRVDQIRNGTVRLHKISNWFTLKFHLQARTKHIINIPLEFLDHAYAVWHVSHSEYSSKCFFASFYIFE